MTIRNTSLYPTPVVRALVIFAARALLVEAWDLDVRVSAAGVAFKGEFFAGRVSISVGAPERFPVLQPAIRGAAPIFHVDWQEGILATAAHEFVHARQSAEYRPFREAEAERAARAVLVVFRGERRRSS